MSTVSTNPQADINVSDEENKTTSVILDCIRKVSNVFWAYTEETGEASTKSYEGLL